MRLITTVIVSILSLQVIAGPYNFARNCTSQGEWTNNALSFNTQLFNELKALKDNPACQGIDRLMDVFSGNDNLNKFQQGISAYLSNDPQKRGERLPSDIFALTTELPMAPEPQANAFVAALLGKTVEQSLYQANSKKSSLTQTSSTLNMGINMVDGLLNQLPQFDECLYNNPNQALTIIGSITSLLANYVGAGNAGIGRVGHSLKNFVTFLQNKRFSRVFNKIHYEELMTSISCLIEATTNNYCRLKDAHEAQNYMEEYTRIRKETFENGTSDDRPTPLEGYFLMKREVPIITRWLQKVQLGVVPRLYTDGIYKSQIFDNITDLLQDIAVMQGNFSDLKAQFYGMKQQGTAEEYLKAKKAFAFDILTEIAGAIGEGSIRGGSKRGTVNFFTRVTSPMSIPFNLIGMDEVPKEVSGDNQYHTSLDWRQWMQNGEKFRPQFDDPEQLIDTIEYNMNRIIQMAQDAGGDYYQQRLIVDIPNLVSESLTSSTITVVTALKRIYQYLGKINNRMVDDVRNNSFEPNSGTWSFLTFPDQAMEDLPVQHNIADTRRKIAKILKEYKNLSMEIYKGISKQQKDKENIQKQSKKIAVNKLIEIQKRYNKKYWSRDKNKNVPLEDLNELTNAILATNAEAKKYYDIVNTVYDEFNIIYQRDTFLITRVGTFVYYDMSYYIKNKINMTQYQQDLMIVAKANLLGNEMDGFIGSEPSKVALDLSQAMKITMEQLNGVERLFADKLMPYLRELKQIEKGDSNSDLTLSSLSLKQLANDSFNWGGNLFDFGYNLVYHPQRYALPLIDLDKIENDDDQYGSIKQLRAKYCIQTLAFSRRADFFDVCKDTVLTAFFDKFDTLTEKNRRLSTSYAETFYQFSKATNDLDQATSINKPEALLKKREARTDNICALRDYNRRNYAFWLIHDMTTY